MRSALAPSTALVVTLALALASAPAASAHARGADILGQPGAQSVPIGAVVEVKIALSGSAGQAQSFDSLDVIFSWDPLALDFIDASQAGAGYAFFLTGFLPNPDGINLDLDDGLAMFTALGPPGSPQVAPPSPASKVVTTLRFQTLALTPATIVSVVPSFGVFSTSRVLLTGLNVTGSNNSFAVIEVVASACPGTEPCFAPHATPGCSDVDCCNAVCDADPSCCAAAWDVDCAVFAAVFCGECGSPTSGCCYSPHDGIGCSAGNCCAAVCATTPPCCEVAWDDACAALAVATCCPADLSGDGAVDGADLGLLIADWGRGGAADFNCDGVVDGADLGLLLAAWGPCTPSTRPS
ncbi:MAG: hypothetical protein U0575_07495 [Phycisphaerales bacterium]|jgi:hypothetical protein